ncbi:MAG TPA: ABC transporter permease [Vicinamibacteria bacterium]|nr:ABC transporter permease [Vicinamibacteria bacterium]
MSHLFGDLRFGARMLGKRPGHSALAVLALALGIGLTTMMFSIVYAAVWRGLPLEDPEELIHLYSNRPGQGIEFLPVSVHDFTDWREQQTSFEDIAAYYAETVNIAGTEGRPIRYLGAYVSARLFDVLRVQPVLGRTFRAEEDHPSTAPVLILSYRAWQDRFEGDPDVIGKTVRANSLPTTIVGVMPEKFGFPGQMDAWLPLRIDPLAYSRGSGPALEGTTIEALGRLKPGVTIAQARAEMNGIARRLETEHPETNEGVGVDLRSLTDWYVGEQARAMLVIMLGAVFGVLLIACANVANLLLTRTLQRAKEVAVRTALGASRIRTVSQLLAETFLLAVPGALLGLGIAQFGIHRFNLGLVNTEPPYWLEVKLDPAVALFVLGLVLFSTFLAGIMPAFRASRASVGEILNDEARGSSSFRLGRLSRALVVGEVAVSCGLLVAAGLMIRTVVNLSTTDFGFDPENVFTARLGLFEADYPTEEDQQQFYDQLTERLESRTGIVSAALTSNLPLTGGPRQELSVEGMAYATDQDHPVSRRIVITPGYFETFGVEPIHGREFTLADGPGSVPVAIVNENFVARYLEDEVPVGSRIRLGGDDTPWRTIVGVVPDLYLGGTVDTQHDGVYIPLSQNVIRFMSLVVRTEREPMSFTSMIRDEIESLDATLPIYWVRSMDENLALGTWFYRAFGSLFMAFGAAAVALATVGLYGVMAFSTSNRTREVGVRVALGASRKDVLILVLRQGVVQLIAGLAMGLLLALALARGLTNLLFQVEPWDPVVFGAVGLALALAGFAACLLPARRACAVGPIRALRYE